VALNKYYSGDHIKEDEMGTNVARTGDMINSYKPHLEDTEKRNHLDKLFVGVWIITPPYPSALPISYIRADCYIVPHESISNSSNCKKLLLTEKLIIRKKKNLSACFVTH
jgi:hypothetical protein